MTPIALLEETERAVGGAQMLELHKRLVVAQGRLIILRSCGLVTMLCFFFR